MSPVLISTLAHGGNTVLARRSRDDGATQQWAEDLAAGWTVELLGAAPTQQDAARLCKFGQAAGQVAVVLRDLSTTQGRGLARVLRSKHVSVLAVTRSLCVVRDHRYHSSRDGEAQWVRVHNFAVVGAKHTEPEPAEPSRWWRLFF